MDWEEVEEALAAVPPDFLDPRFDSLTHVLRILGSGAPDAELDELRAQRAAVDALVGKVVEAYHPGFAASVGAYSRVLREFGEARARGDALRRALEAARRALGAPPAALAAAAARDAAAAAALRALDGVAEAADAPGRAAAAAAERAWPAAAAALLGGAGRLAGGELAGVAALRGLRRELGRRRAALLAAMVADAERLAYSGGAGDGDGGGGPGGGGGGGEYGGAPRARLRGLARARAGFPARADGIGAVASLLLPPPGGAGAGAGGGAAGHLVDPLHELSVLVDCIAQLGGAAEAAAALRARAPVRVAAVVDAALADFAAPAAAYRSAAAAAPGADEPGADADAAVAAAAALVRHVARRAERALGGLAKLLQLLAAARPPKPSAGLEMMLAQQPAAAGDAAGAGAAAPQGEAVAEAWAHLQGEVAAVLAMLLGAPPPTPRLGGGGDFGLASLSVASTPRVAAASPRSPAPPGLADDGPGALAFSIECEIGEAPDAADASAAPAAPGGLPSLLTATERAAAVARALGGRAGAATLVAGAWAPTAALAAAGDRVVAAARGGGAPADGGRTPRSPLLSSAAGHFNHFLPPWMGGGGGGDRGAADAAPNALLAWLDSFLRLEFLPAVFVEFRARVEAALEAPGAFAAAPAGAGGGAPPRAVPAAEAAERMVAQLLGWAAAVPPFAEHIAGVAENVLGRVLAAFSERVAAEAGAGAAAPAAAAAALAGSPPLVQLMAREPAASAAFGAAGAFFVGDGGMEAFTSSVIAVGFGSDDAEAAAEVSRRLAAERPAPGALLAGRRDGVRALAALGTLGASAERLGDSVAAMCAAAAAAGVADGSLPPTPRGAASEGGTPREGWPLALGARLQSLRSLHLPRSPGAAARAPPPRGGHTAGLAHLADRCRALGGHCARTLRLDVLLLAMDGARGLVGALGAGGREIEDRAAALSAALAAADAALASVLPPAKRAYVFGGVPAALGRTLVWALPGAAPAAAPAAAPTAVARLARALGGLAPALLALGGGAGAAGGRELDRARQYYSLLAGPADAVADAAEAKPHRFSAAEWGALLDAPVAGRRVPAAVRERVAAATAAAARGTAAGKRSGGARPRG